ncbi:type I-E CRISPR-associated protein Cas7/Cse4/CasC [Erwinia sp. OLTSP20]|uniref:type I-E CRISPR-associated protein Cas7/Cse4/CasC n=1 Tax=unclassified Erwinia TaxID=2622719 RepID=UPI000C17F6A7|nr:MULTISPECIES: type I-E CRISPR-associated protein Cas7/Cse4/CasC [unclassified Erwinia]PIJ49775.1 type I-E CRISPR-associated protein Cas7/Cse4/CasC [Erwinia sp. OAMSP11]PIJ70874.1 type I-E CRISPR-associated protein Cas7/Cse4/CasC [Erwinia sp. OLSSP12]PIJ80239.1 type I-E CRISPR-associated protein Cas7/Cse4/CasC [Erwinia sp. OLCASP19]PIJ82363.1 type I-E CRISPR-associated protein Cas7/Cse4/CasC [Erwinia sp. OLMTSP26]PIJ85049.1 type I-E CRISPR-associated protein Cas7/Cse4/CasC [Erwinia sp. OLMDS
MNNFINFHVLISHSPSCLNRDDMNMQKDAVFGGKRRVRISSQSLKRAMRKGEYYQQHIGESSIRTIHLELLRDKVHQHFATRYSSEVLNTALSLLSGKTIDQSAAIDGGAVSPWVMDEIDWFCQQLSHPDNASLGNDEKKWSKLLKEQITGLRSALNSAVDIALSGRMATSGLMSELGKVDGAMSLAHAITTHAVESDIDWFTAVDDLNDKSGAAHLGTQEFSAGVFYRYASLNIAQLQENLGGATRAQALTIAAHLAHMLATEIPGAKQHSFAAFNPADLVMVNFSDLPVSLANAFEKPVVAKKEGFLQPSIEALNAYWERVASGYALNGPAAQFILGDDVGAGQVVQMPDLNALKQWIVNNSEA